MSEWLKDKSVREKRAKSKRKNAKKINVHKGKKKRREIGEIASKKMAIRNHCLECVGYSEKEVTECTATKCWMWPWRFGTLSQYKEKE